MERKISHLEPQVVWTHFEDICQVPRPSKKEEKIIAFLEDFASENNFEFKKDEAGNVLISKSASSGFENKPTVILQSHLDMVCEKNNDTIHDFDKDAIKPFIEDGWIKAEGTTLGADCGIGIAASMAVLTDPNVKHGRIECLFTVDEETGLTGAFALKEGFLTGDILLNLDSEDEGEMFVGCAGGVDTLVTFNYEKENLPAGYFPIELKVSGLLGGHSGDDIDKHRGNANKLLVRFLYHAWHKYGIRLADFDGGNLRNAIAREAKVVILIQNGYKEKLVADFNVFKQELKGEYEVNEPDLKIELGSTDAPEFIVDESTTERLINSLMACPHGVYTMSPKMLGMVQTSTNLASIKFKGENEIEVTTSQRSDVESGKVDVASAVRAVFEMAGASVRNSDGYPGWTPNPDSPILKATVDSYKKLFGKQPVVRSIHAGLECGLFLEKYPKLDMVSFGPTIKGAHSPDERINIETTQMFWKHLVDLLANIPE